MQRGHERVGFVAKTRVKGSHKKNLRFCALNVVISFVMISNHPKQEVSPGVASGHTCVRNTKNPIPHPVRGSLCMIVGISFVSIDASTTMRTKKVSYVAT